VLAASLGGSIDPTLVHQLRAERLVRSRASDSDSQLEPYHDRIREVVATGLGDRARGLHARLGDDLVLGAMTRACGLALRDLPAVFGLAHRGLPDRPAALGARGFAIIHRVKNDPGASVEVIRAFFGAARGGAAATGAPPEAAA
jgi:hypothetical protein